MKIIGSGKGFAVKLEEYKGVFSLASYRESNGEYYGQWGKYQKGRDEYFEKAMPIKVVLGDKKQAREVLSQLLDQLCDDKKSEEDDIPF